MAFISIIIPVYNEEKNIKMLFNSVIEIIGNTRHEFEVIFINDGSEDASLDVLNDLSKSEPRFYFIDFSRNFGQQSALKAGYDYASGEAVICMDGDFQNPPELIVDMLNLWEKGNDIVICKRKGGRQSARFIKEYSSRLFYQMLDFISDVSIDHHAPDFRLVDRRVVNAIRMLPENDVFVRGVISWVGFKKVCIEYDHRERVYGSTSYNSYKMVKLAVSAITGFSVRPLYLAVYLGLIISGFSCFYLFYAIVQHFLGNTISGWSSIIVVITLLGGLQLFVLGVIGVYLGKIFFNVKGRPAYIIRQSNLNNVKC